MPVGYQKVNKASFSPAIIAPLNSLKDYPQTGGGAGAQPGSSGSSTTSSEATGRPGDPNCGSNSQVRSQGARVLGLSVPLSGWVTLARYPPLSLPQFSLCSE